MISSNSNRGSSTNSSIIYHLLSSNYVLGIFICIGSITPHTMKMYIRMLRMPKKPLRWSHLGCPFIY